MYSGTIEFDENTALVETQTWSYGKFLDFWLMFGHSDAVHIETAFLPHSENYAFAVWGDQALRRKHRYPPALGSFTNQDKQTLAGIMSGRIARWSQLQVPVGTYPVLLAVEFAELWREGYTVASIGRAWRSRKDRDHVFYMGVDLLRRMRSTVGNTCGCLNVRVAFYSVTGIATHILPWVDGCTPSPGFRFASDAWCSMDQIIEILMDAPDPFLTLWGMFGLSRVPGAVPGAALAPPLQEASRGHPSQR